MPSTFDKVLLEQRVTVYVWVEELEKVISCSMPPAIFRNLKKFTDELRKSSHFGGLSDEAVREIWEPAVEEVLARLHLNTFQM